MHDTVLPTKIDKRDSRTIDRDYLLVFGARPRLSVHSGKYHLGNLLQPSSAIHRHSCPQPAIEVVLAGVSSYFVLRTSTLGSNSKDDSNNNHIKSKRIGVTTIDNTTVMMRASLGEVTKTVRSISTTTVISKNTFSHWPLYNMQPS